MAVGTSGTVTSTPHFCVDTKYLAKVAGLTADNHSVRASQDGKHVASSGSSGGLGGLKSVNIISSEDKKSQELQAVKHLVNNLEIFCLSNETVKYLKKRQVRYISHKEQGKEFFIALAQTNILALDAQFIIREESKVKETECGTLHKLRNIDVNKPPVEQPQTSKSWKTATLKRRPEVSLSPLELSTRMISVEVDPSSLIEGATFAARYIQLVPRKAPISPPKLKLSVDEMLMIPKDIPAANILNPFTEEPKSTPEIPKIYPLGDLEKAQQQQEDAEEAAALVGLEMLDLAPPPEFADDESGISIESTEQATGQNKEQATEATAEELAEINEQRKRDADEFEKWYAKQQQKKHQ